MDLQSPSDKEYKNRNVMSKENCENCKCCKNCSHYHRQFDDGWSYMWYVWCDKKHEVKDDECDCEDFLEIDCSATLVQKIFVAISVLIILYAAIKYPIHF